MCACLTYLAEIEMKILRSRWNFFTQHCWADEENERLLGDEPPFLLEQLNVLSNRRKVEE
jgi:hypothetical protein